MKGQVCAKHRAILSCLVMLWCITGAALSAGAQETAAGLVLELAAQGEEKVSVKVGDTVTLSVTLRLPEETALQGAAIYSMQDELVFDGGMLELVEGSLRPAQGFDLRAGRMEDGVSRCITLSRMESSPQGMSISKEFLMASFELRAVKAGSALVSSVNVKIHDAAGGLIETRAGGVTISIEPETTPEEGGGGAGGGGGGGGGAVTPEPAQGGSLSEGTSQETGVGGDEPHFADVVPSDWYYAAVLQSAQKGWMRGTGEGLFEPDLTMSRAMLVTALYRMAGEPQAELAELPFDDVAQDAWYFCALLWGVKEGALCGVGERRFAPDNAVTREQLAVLLHRLAGEPDLGSEQSLAQFSDLQELSPWAKRGVSWAVERGILTGRGQGILAPGESASRAEVAAILGRFNDFIGDGR